MSKSVQPHFVLGIIHLLCKLMYITRSEGEIFSIYSETLSLYIYTKGFNVIQT